MMMSPYRTGGGLEQGPFGVDAAQRSCTVPQRLQVRASRLA